MKVSEADRMILEAKTAEETKKAIEMGANLKDPHIAFAGFVLAHELKQIEILRDAGADINAMYLGRTPLMEVETGEKTELLLKGGADPNIKDKDGLIAPMIHQSYEKTKIFLEKNKKYRR